MSAGPSCPSEGPAARDAVGHLVKEGTAQLTDGPSAPRAPHSLLHRCLLSALSVPRAGAPSAWCPLSPGVDRS